MKKLIPLLMAISVSLVHADPIYKIVGPDGKVSYTDRPPANAKLAKQLTFDEEPPPLSTQTPLAPPNYAPLPAQELAPDSAPAQTQFAVVPKKRKKTVAPIVERRVVPRAPAHAPQHHAAPRPAPKTPAKPASHPSAPKAGAAQH